MRDYALEIVSEQKGANAKLNVLREYLQAYILRIMSDCGVFNTTSFIGGTALRFLYGLPRFSEDLDFSIINERDYSFLDLISKIKNELILTGYEVAVSYNDKKTVQHAFVKFGELMYEAKISPVKSQKLSIKIEVDTNSPQGAFLKTKVVNKYFPLAFLSYDIASLFSGKLHALLSRGYTKGRDLYDLGWYLSKWNDLSPNIKLLQNALSQTGYKDELPDHKNWKKILKQAVEKTDWSKVEQDVRNFLENPKDLDVFTKENILSLIGG
jgi:predicted nucleotidyltransferase component of viral defense system